MTTNGPSASVGNATVRGGVIDGCVVDMGDNRITTVGDPIMPQDASNKRYVDDLVAGNTFVGVTTVDLTLTGTAPTAAIAATTGSFFITVTNIVTNGPCAVFSVSKNNATATANINTLNGVPGVGDTTALVLTWPNNSGIALAKNNASYDGVYRLAYSPFLTTNDTAINVVLISTTPVTFLPALVGVFQFQIYSDNANGPVATFSVSKNNQTAPASCFKMSGVPGITTNESLRVAWPSGEGPHVYKTGSGYDGIYTIQFR